MAGRLVGFRAVGSARSGVSLGVLVVLVEVPAWSRRRLSVPCHGGPADGLTVDVESAGQAPPLLVWVAVLDGPDGPAAVALEPVADLVTAGHLAPSGWVLYERRAVSAPGSGWVLQVSEPMLVGAAGGRRS